ncbi:hypothetical protein SAMN02745126_05699 [Enhydrobacter aerosaccus]|uniref:Uncharacterized protein n=1 Tax=Enhydrobacter aerosaccus TaxID=225324 RepID=A0A1T4T559_9HYPH|nr:hypothetical protein [Enhydrobacter aerosaccus]SKA35644.1 hypothetical protein SAMN02745126_05699 [Enhydrobacter aerosaccus]
MLSTRTLVYGALAATFVVALAGLSVFARWDVAHRPETHDGWQRIAWPFPRDGWNEGQAWRGHDMELYVRPKLGFCGNCDTGVVEDSEVDRVTDIDLVDPLFVPLEGQHIQIADLVGRMRLYRLRSRGDSQLAAGIAVSYNCDLVVALIVGKIANAEQRQIARKFLEADPVQFWVNRQLGEK